MYAVTSASLTHSFARACAMGLLQRCTCDTSRKPKLPNNQWKWGGCGDNFQFGQKFTKKFLNARRYDEDLRAKLDMHNSNVGIKVGSQDFIPLTKKSPCGGPHEAYCLPYLEYASPGWGGGEGALPQFWLGGSMSCGTPVARPVTELGYPLSPEGHGTRDCGTTPGW